MNSGYDTILVKDCKKLIVKIFVIGYSERGESIVVFFYDSVDEKVLYTVVIDSYKTSHNLFKTIEILEKANVKHVDLLCWTHPDADHTIGIEEIVDNFCDAKSMIYIPEYMNGMDDDPIDYNKNDKHIIDKLFQYNSRKIKNVKPVGCNRQMTGDQFRFCFSDNVHTIDTSFTVYAPHKDYLIENKRANKKIHKNHLSVFLMMQVGPYKFDFTGDVENVTLNNLYSTPFDNPLFVKIPHHASNGSNKLVGLLHTDGNFASCTTTYHAQGLPHQEMVENIKTICPCFHSTGYDESGDNEYGIVEYSFDLFGKQSAQISCSGHACKL